VFSSNFCKITLTHIFPINYFYFQFFYKVCFFTRVIDWLIDWLIDWPLVKQPPTTVKCHSSALLFIKFHYTLVYFAHPILTLHLSDHRHNSIDCLRIMRSRSRKLTFVAVHRLRQWGAMQILIEIDLIELNLHDAHNSTPYVTFGSFSTQYRKTAVRRIPLGKLLLKFRVIPTGSP